MRPFLSILAYVIVDGPLTVERLYALNIVLGQGDILLVSSVEKRMIKLWQSKSKYTVYDNIK
jgi:hypothetical protein